MLGKEHFSSMAVVVVVAAASSLDSNVVCSISDGVGQSEMIFLLQE